MQFLQLEKNAGFLKYWAATDAGRPEMVSAYAGLMQRHVMKTL